MIVRLDKKTRSDYMLPTRTLFKYEDTDGLKVKRWIKIYHTNMNQKKPEVVIKSRQNIF